MPTVQSVPLDAEALERDYAARYGRLLQRSVFPELHKRDELAPLASELLETKGAPSSDLQRKSAAFDAVIPASLPPTSRYQPIAGDRRTFPQVAQELNMTALSQLNSFFMRC
ncbi:hypothetical protein LRP30_31225 [Bradyrhizobium sp. C-145]|uniref:hypothetical protein n=1 Tax=Bradyrhizobium sp. C-145 TaxID=574727 RepID=UPI00201B69C5|nr:hypothetical protein [Bradyrhizobium sp. C-145]UQR68258.1 hypothetical protein LRP30_31225 [Bradyrhizobium sp. C-145]